MVLEEKYNLIIPLLEPGELIKVIDDTLVPNIKPETYFVTSFGRAISVNRGYPIFLTPEPISIGRGQRINFAGINCKLRESIYRLVLMAFNPVPNYKLLEVGHKDGNPLNNKLENLFWREGSYLNYVNNDRDPFVWFDGLLDPDEIALPITEYYIPDIKPIYFVSNKGKVFTISGNCNLQLAQLKYDNSRDGYNSVTLYYNDNTCRHFFVHRLVMIIFRYKPDYELYLVNHIDAHRNHNYVDLNDPKLDNLEWCTPKYNSLWMVICGNAKDQLQYHTVIEIKNLLNTKSVKEIAEIYGVSIDTVYGIKNGKRYLAYIGEELDKWRI